VIPGLRLSLIDWSTFGWMQFLVLPVTHQRDANYHNWPFSGTTQVTRCQKRNFWTLWCKGRFTEADTPNIRMGATLSGLTSAYLHHPPHIFYRLDALPAAQPTVSKH